MSLRKIISFLVVGMLSVGMIGCANTVSEPVQGKVEVVEEKGVKEESKKDMKLVLVDNELVTITVTEKFEKGDIYYKEIGYKVTIVNKSDKNLSIGLDNCSVDGVMNDPLWATTVIAGKTRYETIYWWVGDDSEDFNPNVLSIEDLVNVEFKITVSDEDTCDTLMETNVVIE